MNIVHYLAEKHSNTLSLTRDRRSNGNIASIRLRINKYLLEICCFTSLDYQGFFRKSKERLTNKKRQIRKTPDLKAAQKLTTSQQNLLTDETSYSNSILSALGNLELKNEQSANLTKFLKICTLLY